MTIVYPATAEVHAVVIGVLSMLSVGHGKLSSAYSKWRV